MQVNILSDNLFSKVNIKSVIAFSLCAVIAFGVVAYDCFFAAKESNKSFVAMGTVITSSIWTKNNPEIQQQINDEINALEKSLLSKNVDTSEVGRLNKEKSASVSEDLADILLDCKEVSKDSNGAFDVTICPVSTLWDFGGENQRLPSENEIEAALSKINYESINVKGTNVTIGNEQSIDLGAVGKGYTCDKIKALLEECRAQKAIISVGGSLLLYGNHKFTIGVANPSGNKLAMGTIDLKDCFISTSGDYEKYFEQDGKKYHHILDARTGYPADGYLSSVTVICDSGLLSDALSTACFIMGYNESLDLLKKYDAEAIFIFKDKTVKCTDGVADKFKITNNTFKMEK